MSATLCSWSGRVSRAAPLPSLAGWAARAQGLRQPLTPRPVQHLWAASTPEGATAGLQSAATQADAERPADAEFQAKLDLLEAWRERYYDCIVPRKVHDARELGEWVHKVRAARRRGVLPPAQAAALNALGFAWQVDVITAKWYHNLHAARHYREVHGTGEVPADLVDPSGQHPDWVEAGRWLERQKDLYRRQKLLLLRVRLMKEVLGIKLEREHSRPRRNIHPVLKQGNKAFREEQRRRQAAAKAAAGGGHDGGAAQGQAAAP